MVAAKSSDKQAQDMVSHWGGERERKPPKTTQNAPTSASGVLETSLVTSLPTDALLTSAIARITLSEGGTVAAGLVARVRNGETSRVLVVDFGALRTVSSLALPSGKTLSTLAQWVGNQFKTLDNLGSFTGKTAIAFSEIQTERLELTFGSNIDAVAAANQLLVTIPSAPTDLAIEIAGSVAWSRPGPARFAGNGRFEIEVPITEALQAALAKGANPRVTLRSATPCRQQLALDLAFVRVHEVNLPPSGLVVNSEIEAEADAFLALPAASSDWQVVGLEFTVSGRLPSWRAWPVPELAENTDARLVLDPAHSYAARLPTDWLAPLATLAAVRLPVELPPGFGGAELAAVLYQGDLETPTEPVAAARFRPTALAASATGGRVWVEIELAKPVKVAVTAPPGSTSAAWWVEISATRGGVDWPLSAVDDEADPDHVRLRRSLPGPPFRPLAVQLRRGNDTLLPAGTLRVIGTPRSDELRPAVVPLLQGNGAPQLAPGFTPSPTSGVVSLTPAPAATAARGEIGDDLLRLRLRLHSAGQVTLSTAKVYYQD